MSILRPFLEFVVVFWTTWVVVFQLAIAVRIPTRWLLPLFLVALAGAIMPWSRGWLRSLRRARRSDRRLVLELAGVAVILAGVVLVASRPDADDLGYLRGPLVDAADPSEPIRIDRFRWDDRPWPVLRVLNENEAFEPFVVMASGLIGLDPLVGYHNVFAALSVVLWCAVLAGLLHHVRVPRRWISGAVLASGCLLFLDGATHHSFGNMTLIRLWQGKVVAWAVMLPLFVLCQLRFLARPRVSRFALVVMAATVCVAFNRSMVVLVVVAGTAVPMAYAMVSGSRRHRLRRAAWALAAPAPGWILGAVVLALVSRSSPEQLAGALAGWTTSTEGAVVAFDRIAGGSWAIVVRDLLLLGVLPLVVLARPLGRLVVAFGIVGALISYAPPIGGLLSMALGPAVWRLYYVLPIPLCLALLVLVVRPDRGVARWRGARRGWIAGLIAGLIGLSWACHFVPVLSARNGVEWKAPLETRFPAGVREFIEVAGPRLENHRVLAPEQVAVALGLTHFDSVELIATREGYVTGDRRLLVHRAGRALTECTVKVPWAAALRELLDEGAALVVFAECDRSTYSAFEETLDVRLEELVSAGGYGLFEVQARTPPETSPNRRRARPEP
ncbi:MAG: DUF6077 domain-containing protein [Thermoanaerobaculia bacterium]|nr:DUF6077 domain-containing protein [Thermoanaerobaculia bacterium]